MLWLIGLQQGVQKESSYCNMNGVALFSRKRVTCIRRCQLLDTTHGEIRVLLRFHGAPDDNCDAVNDLLDAHIGHVAARINEFQRLQMQLRELRRQCGEARQARDCGILNQLSMRPS